MSSTNVDVVVVMTDEPAAVALVAASGSELMGATRRELDGRAAEWVVLGSIAVRALHHVLDAVLEYVRLTRVKAIKVGDVEIENPSSTDVERLLDSLQFDESPPDL